RRNSLSACGRSRSRRHDAREPFRPRYRICEARARGNLCPRPGRDQAGAGQSRGDLRRRRCRRRLHRSGGLACIARVHRRDFEPRSDADDRGSDAPDPQGEAGAGLPVAGGRGREENARCRLPVLRRRRGSRPACAQCRGAPREVQPGQLMKHEIVITAQGHKGTMERLQNEFAPVKLWEAADREATLKAAAHVRGLAHFGHSKVDGKLMDALPKLEIISNFGVGVDQIDLVAAKKRNVIVTNTPNVLNECVADCAMSLVLNTLRKFGRAEDYLRAGSWATHGPYPLTASLGGKVMGVLGLGRIGEAIAQRAQAFGMKIRYHKRNRKNVSYEYDPDPVTLARNSDVLIVVTPGGAETAKLVGAAVLDALGPSGYLVNV